MILISRQLGQAVVIGEDIVIRILKVSADKVQFGISVPAGMPVHREEALRPAVPEILKKCIRKPPLKESP